MGLIESSAEIARVLCSQYPDSPGPEAVAASAVIQPAPTSRLPRPIFHIPATTFRIGERPDADRSWLKRNQLASGSNHHTPLFLDALDTLTEIQLPQSQAASIVQIVLCSWKNLVPISATFPH